MPYNRRFTDSLPDTGGIYEIINRVTGKRYLGSTTRFRTRRRTHWWNLEAGRHHSARLQASWNKHGSAAFEFVILEHAPDALKEGLLNLEDDYMKRLKPEYNMSETAQPKKGKKAL